MRTMMLIGSMLIGFGLATCLAALSFAASTAPAPGARALREECSELSQAGMRDCLAKHAQDSQKALRNIEEEAVSALSGWDEESRYVSQAKAKLAASNREFARYRDRQCEFSASLSGGGAGNAHEIRRLACVWEFNNRRAEQLRDAVSDLPRKSN